MVAANDIKRGMVIKSDGELYVVVDFHLLTPGNWRGMVQTKLKSLKQGNVIQKRFRSTDRLEDVFVEFRTMEYLYNTGEDYCLMDTETLEQIFITKAVLEEALPYMPLNSQIRVSFYEGQPISVDLPAAVTLKVTETAPGAKGDTVTNVFKPATLETGLVIKVPLFINTGALVKVDTRTGEFLSRA
ncbi:MAG TPA: elongation factor P [Candidatus Hypogeohydataceae bacterium YC38]